MSEKQLSLIENSSTIQKLNKIIVPPIKCQGIKTKIIPYIKKHVKLNKNERWVEPFLGSGVALFNIKPDKCLVSDINPHIINFYKKIQSGDITADAVSRFLKKEGDLLREKDGEHFYSIRQRFNEKGNPLDFLFLNRSCFNGVMRFNSKGKFNVPYGHKRDRFRQAYITKIVNQVKNVNSIMQEKNWTFLTQDWRKTLDAVEKNDFVYLDPPYIGRHTDYFNTWVENDAMDMAEVCKGLDVPFIVSMWKSNKYRENDHLKKAWNGFKMIEIDHFYHVGSTENLRNKMVEVLILGNIK